MACGAAKSIKKKKGKQGIESMWTGCFRKGKRQGLGEQGEKEKKGGPAALLKVSKRKKRN